MLCKAGHHVHSLLYVHHVIHGVQIYIYTCNTAVVKHPDRYVQMLYPGAPKHEQSSYMFVPTNSHDSLYCCKVWWRCVISVDTAVLLLRCSCLLADNLQRLWRNWVRSGAVFDTSKIEASSRGTLWQFLGTTAVTVAHEKIELFEGVLLVLQTVLYFFHPCLYIAMYEKPGLRLLCCEFFSFRNIERSVRRHEGVCPR